ncbi:septum formation initiator family protein [Paenibacillus yanchengensis]|uniref:Septum formation initiator family protein n=1 Tax=Paenibacillus yanchengensis TaxID=2035833 RepID=A0ABW4YI86_9BACL
MVPAVGEKKTTNAASKRRLKIWLTFIAIFVIWAGYTLFGQYQQHQEAIAKVEVLQEQVEEAIAIKADLQKQIDRLNDPEYIAQLATKEQGMVKEGEQQIFTD